MRSLFDTILYTKKAVYRDSKRIIDTDQHSGGNRLNIGAEYRD